MQDTCTTQAEQPHGIGVANVGVNEIINGDTVGVMKTTPTLPLDKSTARIEPCKFKDIRHIFQEFHYKKAHMGGGISVCFAMFINNQLVGGSVLGKPRHEKKYQNCIDIRRMALLDSAPQNSESYF